MLWRIARSGDLPQFFGLIRMDRLYHGSGHKAVGTRLIPVSKWNEYHDWPPPGGLRHLIYYSKGNGFQSVIRRVGRRLLIDEAAFFAWVETQSGTSVERDE